AGPPGLALFLSRESRRSTQLGGLVVLVRTSWLPHSAARQERQRVRLSVYWMVAGYQRWPPCAVGMRSALSLFAIAARLLPALRSRLIRSIAYWDILGGRPSRTPCARL